MKNVHDILARKYAQAFLNCFGEEINRDQFKALCDLEFFFRSNKKILYFLSLSNIDLSIKKSLMHTLFDQFGVAQHCDRLVNTLLSGKRGQLLHAVLKKIIVLYKQQKGIVSFLITSPYSLSSAQIAVIQQFLAHTSGFDIIYEYAVDKSLIAGIRMQSEILLWEYSIGKQLGIMSHKFTR